MVLKNVFDILDLSIRSDIMATSQTPKQTTTKIAVANEAKYSLFNHNMSRIITSSNKITVVNELFFIKKVIVR